MGIVPALGAVLALGLVVGCEQPVDQKRIDAGVKAVAAQSLKDRAAAVSAENRRDADVESLHAAAHAESRHSDAESRTTGPN